MLLKESHIVPCLDKPIRLQEYAVGIFLSKPTKSSVKKAIKKGFILISGKETSTAKFISGGEKIELYCQKEHKSLKRLKLDLEVLFEDNFLAIIYKPAGILVSGNGFVTITNALSQNLKKSNQIDAVKPQPIHRLDYPTSGLLLIGKTASAIQKLSKLFENKEIKKTYFAISIGKMKPKGYIGFPIDNKKSLTHFEVQQSEKSERFGFLNLIKLHPKTGRKHQLRKHLLSIGNPILGDKDYFLKDKVLNGKGLYLHASTLEFTHPFTQEKMIVSKNLPKKFKKIFPDY